MNKTKKRSFIKELCRSVEKDIVAKVDHMPEEWDGIELRQYIVEMFAREAVMTDPYHKKDYAKRLRAFNRAKLGV